MEDYAEKEPKGEDKESMAHEMAEMPDPRELVSRFNRIKLRHADRDERMQQVRAIRAGQMSQIAPDLFPTVGAFQQPIVANMIDIAARDMAEMIAPLPSFNCTSPTMTSERERERASLRTKIALGYVTASNLQVQMYSAADAYVTYGALPIRVEIDYERNMPVLRTLDPVGSYAEQDRFGRVKRFFQHVTMNREELCHQFPELKGTIMKGSDRYTSAPSDADVVFYHDDDWDLAFLLGPEPAILSAVPNPVGKVMIRIAQRAGVTSIPRGQFDDVIFVQLAKARFALLAMEAAHEAVNAPLVVPADVPEVPYGPGAVIRTNNPGGVGRVPQEIPAAAFAEQQSLERELQQGSRFPQVRTGNADASIVTGKGVQALMGGYDSQIRAHQAIFARVFEELIGLCFEVDELVFGSESKSLRGSDAGIPFEIEYTPTKAIKGNYTVDVTYGLMAGLDPNRWLVFALQAQGAGLLSKDFLRREMPVDIDVEEEDRKSDIEDLTDAAKQAIMGYAQSIPALAAQGQDPSGPLLALAKVIEGRRAGKPLADIVVEAFTPPAPPEPTPEELAAAAPEVGMAPEMGMETPEGLMASGAMQGVAPGQMGQAPGGRPDLQTLLAGLDASGRPNLSASVKRQTAI